MNEQKGPHPDTGREIRSGNKGVDVRPVIQVDPGQMPKPSGLVPQQSSGGSGGADSKPKG